MKRGERRDGAKNSTRGWSVLTVTMLLAPAMAGAWEVDGAATRQELEAFHESFGVSSHLFARHKAEPLGWTGFEVWADSSFLPDYEQPAVSGSLPGDGLAASRVGIRKGFPKRINLGVAVGRAGALDLLDAELEWAILRGGAAQPALAARLTAGRAEGDDVYELSRWGAELVLSKGFGPVTPFVSAGVVRSEGEFRPFAAAPFKSRETQEVLAAGVTLSLLLPRITISVEQAEEIQAAVRLSVGF